MWENPTLRPKAGTSLDVRIDHRLSPVYALSRTRQNRVLCVSKMHRKTHWRATVARLGEDSAIAR